MKGDFTPFRKQKEKELLSVCALTPARRLFEFFLSFFSERGSRFLRGERPKFHHLSSAAPKIGEKKEI